MEKWETQRDLFFTKKDKPQDGTGTMFRDHQGAVVPVRPRRLYSLCAKIRGIVSDKWVLLGE